MYIKESIGMIRLYDGREFLRVMYFEDAVGWEFDGYERAKCFETIEDAVKSRIRK